VAKLTTEEICDVETTKAGRTKVRFNASKASEQILSKLPVAYIIEYSGRRGLVWWNGEVYSHGSDTILRNVFDRLAGNAATNRGTNAAIDLMRAKLLILPSIEMGSGLRRFALYRREQRGTEV
jgi:hypothetical protein